MNELTTPGHLTDPVVVGDAAGANTAGKPRLPRVGLLSLEPWDEVWRRNQHLASRLVSDGFAESVTFIAPPAGGWAPRATRSSPLPGIDVFSPPLIVPRRCGGYRLLAWWHRRALRDVDLLWINDPVAGVGARSAVARAVYDITDDWRSMPQSPVQRRRLVDAEDSLARSTATVVCSAALAERWFTRYGINAAVVPNGVDVGAIRRAAHRRLEGPGPHVVYVGTLHDNRLDVDLVANLAKEFPGTVHLVGPDHLEEAARVCLQSRGVRLHGPAPTAEVPSWLVSADVLICPHVVDDFTLSLDAIKSHEYLATDRPVVATPSCGFQSLTAPGLWVAGPAGFRQSIDQAVGSGSHQRQHVVDWAGRTRQFAIALRMAAADPGRCPIATNTQSEFTLKN